MAVNTVNVEEPHPFDSAFKIIKEMRSELQGLRAQLQAEQQQRATEVNELKNEVNHLREALAKEAAERTQTCLKLTTDLTKETSSRGKNLDELRAQHRQQLGQLSQVLQDEVRERKAAEHMLETKETTDTAERKAENERLNQELADHKRQFVLCKEDHATRIGHLTHDMQMVSSYLQKVSAAWECLKGGKMLSSQRPGDPNPSSPASPTGRG